MLVTAGSTLEKLEHDGIIQAMQSVIVVDRFHNAGFLSGDVVFFPNLDLADEPEVRDLLDRAYSLGALVAKPE